MPETWADVKGRTQWGRWMYAWNMLYLHMTKTPIRLMAWPEPATACPRVAMIMIINSVITQAIDEYVERLIQSSSRWTRKTEDMPQMRVERSSDGKTDRFHTSAYDRRRRLTIRKEVGHKTCRSASPPWCPSPGLPSVGRRCGWRIQAWC